MHAWGCAMQCRDGVVQCMHGAVQRWVMQCRDRQCRDGAVQCLHGVVQCIDSAMQSRKGQCSAGVSGACMEQYSMEWSSAAQDGAVHAWGSAGQG